MAQAGLFWIAYSRQVCYLLFQLVSTGAWALLPAPVLAQGWLLWAQQLVQAGPHSWVRMLSQVKMETLLDQYPRALGQALVYAGPQSLRAVVEVFPENDFAEVLVEVGPVAVVEGLL